MLKSLGRCQYIFWRNIPQKALRILPDEAPENGRYEVSSRLYRVRAVSYGLKFARESNRGPGSRAMGRDDRGNGWKKR